MNSNDFDIIIIGAGPAGLFCAIEASGAGEANKKVLILEKNKNAGEKLLITGSGQCNITHTGNSDDFLNHYGKAGRFVKNALYCLKPEDVCRFFEVRQIPLVRNDKGKIFPESLKASHIRDGLLLESRRKGVQFRWKEPVKSIHRIHEEQLSFKVLTNPGEYKCSYLVLATGGKSYPATGSTGDGYHFAQSLGHKISEPRPGLSPVLIRNHILRSCSGISRENTEIQHYRNGRKISEMTGDLLITHKGFSGPVILDGSTGFLNGDLLKISFLPGSTQESLEKTLLDKENLGKKTLKSVLSHLGIPERLVLDILSETGISPDKKLGQLERKERKQIVEYFLEFPAVIKELGDFSTAMVTSGGIDLKEVNSKTMESRICRNLLFCGEILDVTGDTGGYNLQFALSSGALAGRYFKEQENRA